METTTIIERLSRELTTILILLERPVVQLQLVAIFFILLFGWFCAHQLAKQRHRFNGRLPDWGNQHFLRLLLKNALLPFLIFVILQLTILALHLNRYPTNILQNVRFVVLLALLYQVVLSALYLRYGSQTIKPLHGRVFRPTIIIFLAYLVVNDFVNIPLISQISLIPTWGEHFNIGVLVRSGLIAYLFSTVVYFLQDAQKRPDSSQDTHSALIVGRYIAIALGIFAVAASLGIDLSTLTLIGGGLSIGIGFGLQQIVANFISGILLLFEQSLRPGDVINLDGNLGLVQEVNIRSSTILTKDNVEIIVPNEQFLTTNVTTYTRESNLVRVPIEFGVSYSSDPQFVRDLVLRTVVNHGSVKNRPAPEVQFVRFGDSSLDFRVLVWMDNPIIMPRFRSDLYFMIWDAFSKHGIEIPFPQRDIHIRSGQNGESTLEVQE